jgi:putative peptidoglycan lipid II flippase
MSDARGGRGATIIGAGILLSRLVGLLRQTAFAHFLGAGAAADAYNVAFRIPNALRNLLGEGTLTASFVPVYSQLLAGGDEKDARTMANAVLGVLLLVTSVLTLGGMAAAPHLTAVLAPGFTGASAELTTRLTRILFPMTGLMVLSGWCLGVQNAHRRFFWSYASAALWSVAQIALLVVGGPRASDAVTLAQWLAWATLVGALLQITAQLPDVLALVGLPRPSLAWRLPSVQQVLRNLAPVITALGVVQLSSFVDLQIASYLPEGAPSVLAYAYALLLLPVSLFGVSVAAAALPELARDSVQDTLEVLRERVRAGWQRILFYVIPSALVFMTLGDYCIALLYRGGQFGADTQRQVHVVLAAYAVGLVSYGSVKLLGSAFFALQDYRTPLQASIASLVASAATAVAIAMPWRESPFAAAGIALGSALGSYVNLAVLAMGLRRRLGALYTPAMWVGTRRIVAAAIVATLVGAGVRLAQMTWWPLGSPRIIGLPALAAYGATYLAVAWWMGSAEAARWLRRPPR